MEAAGAGAGGTAYPLDNIRSIFATLGMIITHRDGMINAYNLMGIDDFEYFRVNDDESFVKV